MADIDLVPKSRSSAWIWWVVAAIIIVALIFWMMSGRRSSVVGQGSQLDLHPAAVTLDLARTA
jgi:bacteriorhodopsin